MEQKKHLLFLQVGVLAVAFIVLYFPFLQTLVHDWNVNDNFSHGYLIPPIAAFMVWHGKNQLKDVKIQPNLWGLILILAGLLQLIVAKIGAEYFLQRTSMILVLFGLTLFLLGTSWTKKLSIPMLYLLFMIPIPAILWNQIAFPLQLFASKASTFFIQLLGIPIYREGNILHLADTTLQVVDACSGLRSLTSLLALSAAFAYISSLRTPSKWLLFLSAVPIAIAVNIVRLTSTAVLADQIGPEMAHGFLHEMSGLLVFVFAFVLLFLFHGILAKAEKRVFNS